MEDYRSNWDQAINVDKINLNMLSYIKNKVQTGFL
jgi:hypothetical protein